MPDMQRRAHPEVVEDRQVLHVLAEPTPPACRPAISPFSIRKGMKPSGPRWLREWVRSWGRTQGNEHLCLPKNAVPILPVAHQNCSPAEDR